LDKILTVLIRKRPEEMTQYINTGGNIYGRETLISDLLQHLYSHSIMQIAQRLLLPQRPVGNNAQQQQQQQQQQQGTNGDDDAGGDEIVAGENDYDAQDEGMLRCDWSNSQHALGTLLEILIPAAPSNSSSSSTILSERILDLSLNASEVLITIIQNSMLSSNIMLWLTSSATMARLVDAASRISSSDYFSPSESLCTSAMNVLESLILQLGGYGAIGTMTILTEDEEAAVAAAALVANQKLEELFEPSPKTNHPKNQPEANEASPIQMGDKESSNEELPLQEEKTRGLLLIADLTGLLEHLPTLLQNFSNLLRHPSTATWTTPTQFSKEQPQPMLGNSRLRIVRVIESLVLLGDPDVDAKLVQSDCLEICLDLFWEFQWCSMLHQSVANLLVHVFEGQNTRYDMQQYFLVKCNLLGRLMNSFSEDEIARPDAGGVVGLSEKNSEVVENMQDMEAASAPVVSVSSGESEKDGTGSGTTPLPVSEDDVDAAAAMESQMDDELVLDSVADSSPENTQAKNMEMLSTEAVRFDSRASSTVGDIPGTLAPPQVFRFGYMGHVIIICQALVHAYTNEHPEMAESDEATEIPDSHGNNNEVSRMSQREEITLLANDAVPTQVAENEFIGPKDDFGEPLMLFEIVHTHPMAERWHTFVETVLATEIAIQSTALGGYNVQAPGMDPMQCHRPGLVDDGYMMGDDGERPPVPPRGMSGGGDMIDMDDNDLDVAASMMAGLSLGGVKTGVTAVDDSDNEDDNSSGGNSGNSDRSYNSGETANDRTGYAFDDPLGKTGGLGIELGKLTKYKHSETRRTNASTTKQEDDDGSHSSSDEEPETQQDSDNDVPVMDLFAGNFNNNYEPTPMKTTVVEQFANFADFDKGEDAFGDFESAEPLPPSETRTDLKEGDSSLTDRKKTDMDDIFGSGDHANLLEQEEDEPAADSGDVAEVQKKNELIHETVAHSEFMPEIVSPEVRTSSPDDKKPSDDR
jgi:hypothetical protein